MEQNNEFLVAECAIRQLHARYVDCVLRKDYQAFGACFAADAEWKIAGLHIRGRDRIAAQLEQFLSAIDRVMMFLGTPLLEVGRGTASGRLTVSEYAKLKDGSAARSLGVYYDRYIEQEDGWRFQWRHWSLHYRGPPDFSAPFQDTRDYGPPPDMPGPDDPSIARRNP